MLVRRATLRLHCDGHDSIEAQDIRVLRRAPDDIHHKFTVQTVTSNAVKATMRKLVNLVPTTVPAPDGAAPLPASSR